MNVYVFQASLLCEPCGVAAQASLPAAEDSGSYPIGPYSDGGGEADSPQHCDHCGLFLRNPLTGDGVEYVREHSQRVRDFASAVGQAEVTSEWQAFYADML